MNNNKVYLVKTIFILVISLFFTSFLAKEIVGDVTYLGYPMHQFNNTCNSPTGYDVKDIESNQATIEWEDDSGLQWEYIVQLSSDPYPTGITGVTTSSKENIITIDYHGNVLQPDTEYEFYVRTDCGADGYSNWLGPYNFRTLCASLTLPYTESFEISSNAIDCWFVLDGDGNGTGSGNTLNNTFHRYSSSSYAKDGIYSMRFYGNSASASHDDWLISPAVAITDTEILQVTYHYRTNASYNNEFEVLLSNSAVDPDSFTTVLVPKTTYKNAAYEKKTVYVTGFTGNIHIGWHVVSSGLTHVYLDLITIEKVDCIGFEDKVEVRNINTDSADFEWEDEHNNQWEYFVQDAGGATPVGSGTLISSKKVTATRTSGTSGSKLQPDTEYEFYVRSACGPGKNSKWIGPVSFKTSCSPFNIPFKEGFDKNSSTVECWRVKGTNDKNFWRQNYNTQPYEGDGCMAIINIDPPIDEWLISPPITLEKTKLYRLDFYYQIDGEFELLLSDNGEGTTYFTETLIKSKYNNNLGYWNKKTIIIGDIGGVINIAWHVKTEIWKTSMYLDNISLEEVNCSEPVELDVKNIYKDKATIYWEDDFGSDWEYVVQKSGGKIPKSGIAVMNNQINVTQDSEGNSLEYNTSYEFYVRTACGNGKFGEWSGPYVFKTTCGVLEVPFWEGFNINSNTINCWEIVDNNNDSYSNLSPFNIWNTASVWGEAYEGSHAMKFFGDQNNDVLLPHNDWLISPAINFDPAKTYRLKYHYKTEMAVSEYEFEVLLSNSGTNLSNFTNVVVPKKKYDSMIWGEWKEEYVFISGISGEVNIAWHITAKTQQTYLYLDNIFIEEVEGCPEPLPTTLAAKDEQSNSAVILWEDDTGGTQWEYYVQEEDKGVPTGNGAQTTQTENIVTHEQSGKVLKPNTEYEFYVRTDCGSGEYSIWQGPYKFVTTCDNSSVSYPYWEGFNSLDKTYGCWTIIDGNGDSTSPLGNDIWHIFKGTSGVYEGDQSMYFFGSSSTHDDWLISPSIKMDAGRYVLKFHYMTNASPRYNSSFEVLLSSSGTKPDDFTTTLLPTQVYREGNFVEEVIFFTGLSGDINLAWHVNSTGNTLVYLDNISLEKIDSCAEPYNVKVIDKTSNSIDIEWLQEDGITEWEVIVVEYGAEATDSHIKELTVIGNPKTTITSLDGGRTYTIYVRAKCKDGQYKSDWSTPVIGNTLVGANDNCNGAITIPVNDQKECLDTVSGTMLGAGSSIVDEPDCDLATKKRDVWFEFTATQDTHVLKIEDWVNLDGGNLTNLYGAIYDVSCNSITGASAMECFIFNTTTNYKAFRNLTVGQKYYIRLATTSTAEIKHIFNLCITSPSVLEVSPSGEKYTMEELVKKVLIESTCDLISNVKYQNGDGSPATQNINTVGYFNRNGSDFPFEQGIVLSTSEVQYVPGPYTNSGKGSNPHRWIGDKDLNDAINDAGGKPQWRNDMRVTQLEFDFVPIKDSISFEYLFASNSYASGCDFAYTCTNGALFAAWLIDTTTGEGVNLAKIKGENIPISLYTIWDNEKIKAPRECTSYPELFWNAYHGGNADRLDALINFAGSTIAMKSETVYVIPGRQYHIKLAVMDFCPTDSHSSAVFFNANSFDIGNLDLGVDLLVENGNALCESECITIKSGLGSDEDMGVIIQWYKDGKPIQGATGANYEACESGIYRVVGKYPEINCEVEGEKVIEIYPPISEKVNRPSVIEVCRYSLSERRLDLSTVEKEMFVQVEREDYATSYYLTEEEALQGSDNTIEVDYLVQGKESQEIFILVKNLRTGCTEVFALPIHVQKGDMPSKPEHVLVCAEYIFPDLEKNQYYYTEPSGQGEEYKTGDILSEPGEHTIYVLQINNEEGCYEEISYKVNITAPVTADIFEDKTLSCEYYELKPLSEHNQYFTEPGGNGDKLYPGMQILQGQTIYVYASSKDSLCIDESSFTIDYEDCPIPKGISPNNDGLNDVFDLTPHGVENIKIYNRWGTEVYSHGEGYTTQWHGQNKKGKQLPDGTYYYVIQAHGKTRTGWIQINK